MEGMQAGSFATGVDTQKPVWTATFVARLLNPVHVHRVTAIDS